MEDEYTASDRIERVTSPERLDRPIFVGGTGRSGTTVTGELIGASRLAHTIPIEIRFHVDREGLTDVVDGRLPINRFIWKMHKHWYRRTTAGGHDRGLHKIATNEQLQQATDAFRTTAPTDSIGAARRLMSDLLDPLAHENEAVRWAEMTPPNILRMHGLQEIYPKARFVHVYRDGRDVAHSVTGLTWGPNDTDGALRWWEQTLVEGLNEMRGLEETVLLVSMEDLVIHRRSETLERLFGFLELPVDADVERYFDQRMSPDKANVGRWTRSLSPPERREMNRRYGAAIERISRQYPSIDLHL